MVCTSLISHCTALQVAERRLQAEGFSCLMCNSFEHGHKNPFPSVMSQMVPYLGAVQNVLQCISVYSRHCV